MTDYDGSGQCYLTGCGYREDVDDGHTYLVSPVIDLSELDADVHYALWYTNFAGYDPHNDLFKTYVSNNDGDEWVLVETVGPETVSGWFEHAFIVSEFVTPTAQVRVRFEASDLHAVSIVEAGIDAFYVRYLDCDGCPGDLDGDGDVDLADLAILLAAYNTCDGDPFYNPDADLDDSGCVDLADLAALLAEYGCGT